jgi:hypothetical protein
MTVWFHLSTSLNLPLDRRLVFRVSYILLLCIALITTLFFVAPAKAAPGINRTIGFQGRLLDTQGNIVRDGYYNVQFKIYQGGSGNAANNPDGTLKWTETYINNGTATGAVEVKNGFMSVNLGSQTPFGSTIDWNQDTLWLSMNIAGSSIGCTTFGTGACAADGEMLPMKRMTATPFALNAGAINGKTADNFIQMAQGVQTDASVNTSSIFINKTSTGNLIQLQNTATNVFTINNDGNLQFGSNADHSVSVATSAASAIGKNLSLGAGTGGSGTGSTGGALSLQGGTAGGTNGNGGNVSINAGAKTGTGTDGTISIGTTNGSAVIIGSTSAALNQNISIGTNNTAGSTSNVTIGAGNAAGAGDTIVQAKGSVAIKTNGTTRATFSDSSNTVYFGNGVSASTPNNFSLQGTNSSSAGVAGGSLGLQGGNATTGNTNGGNITLSGGTGTGTGANGLVVMNTPTFSTVSDDANCYTSGAVVATSCTITSTSVNNAASIIVGFSTTGKVATLPDPTITTAGRVIYVTASKLSKDFTLAINGGGAGNRTTVRQNSTTSVMWNGSDWTVADASNYGLNTTDNVENLQIGSADDSTTTLLTVDKGSANPTVTDTALLGSMYYNTTLGKLQCYEADGWGACSSSPDTFVSLTPEYANAVINGAGTGTMTSDFCSDFLNVNDGSSSQPTVCGLNETNNYYRWTTTTTTASQTKSIYVSYQLPSTFKNFTAGSTSLLGRTSATTASVNYQIYKNNAAGLTACGSTVAVSTGVQTLWQKGTAATTSDPSTCSFAAGNTVVFKINLSTQSNSLAYSGNLNFAFTSQ